LVKATGESFDEDQKGGTINAIGPGGWGPDAKGIHTN
jgi:hypothetical protein